MTKKYDEKKLKTIEIVSMLIMALAFFFVQFHRNTPGVMRTELIEAFGMRSTSFGLFSSMYFYPYMLAQIPVGMLLDSIGVRKTVGLGSGFAAIGALLFGVSNSYVLACIGRLFIGVGVAAPVIGTQKFLINWVGSKKSASYYGVFSFIGKLGGMFAQLPLAWLLSQFNWRVVFFFCASISAIIAVLCLLVARDSAEEARSAEKLQIKNTSNKTIKELLQEIIKVFCNKYMWFAFVVMFLQQGLYGLFSSTWAVPYLQDSFNLSSVEASSYTTCMLVGAMFFAIVMGIASDSLHSRKIVIVFVSASLLAVWTLLAFCGMSLMSTHLMWAVMFLMGAGGSGVQILFAYSREVNNPEYVGISVSVINMVGMLGSAVCPTAFGAILDSYAGSYAGINLYTKAFIPCIILSLIGLICSILLKDTHCENILSIEQKK